MSPWKCRITAFRCERKRGWWRVCSGVCCDWCALEIPFMKWVWDSLQQWRKSTSVWSWRSHSGDVALGDDHWSCFVSVKNSPPVCDRVKGRLAWCLLPSSVRVRTWAGPINAWAVIKDKNCNFCLYLQSLHLHKWVCPRTPGCFDKPADTQAYSPIFTWLEITGILSGCITLLTFSASGQTHSSHLWPI